MKRAAPPRDGDGARNKRRARAEEVAPHVRRAVGWLRNAAALHVPSPATKYRNKMTYSMHSGRVVTSELGSDACNAVVDAVAAWVCRELPEDERARFHEVGVKCSRRGGCMIRVMVVCPAAALESFREKLGAFALHFAAEHGAECVYAQHSESSQKPKKTDPYMYFHGAELREATPWGDEYMISPDTFSEVNHDIEHKMWDFYEEVLTAGGAPPGGELVLMGRDSNATLVSIFPRLHAAFTHATCLPHCPRVHADLLANHERYVKPRLAGAQTVEIAGVDGKFDYAAKVAALGSAGRPLTVMVNSGRGGLARETAAALAGNRGVHAVVYVTCNQHTCYQDVDVLLQGAAGERFVVADYRAFDFMPGTEYLMQVFVLRRAPRQVVVPVGPPGSGKSTVGLALVGLLAPRAGAGEVEVVERDRIYAAHRDGGMSLKAAKRATHAAVLAALGDSARAVVYYDSTNGDPGGRELTVQTFHAAAPPASDRPALVVHFHGMSVDWLLANCAARVGHPSFPAAPDAARLKIDNVLLGLTPPGAAAAPPSFPCVVVSVDPQQVPPAGTACVLAAVLTMATGLTRRVAPTIADVPPSVAVRVMPFEAP
eukprot:TRINITY_DN22409_c0_g1_i1.p1 TRINITY_DN22409_c0_g1~~TRINITY_DN22409_c0_g1_i1.p1  ORF type:complete len:599 (+),score=180.57 TRINITY_DN22409_c0_g1_i1:57-1853(+)